MDTLIMAREVLMILLIAAGLLAVIFVTVMFYVSMNRVGKEMHKQLERLPSAEEMIKGVAAEVENRRNRESQQ